MVGGVTVGGWKPPVMQLRVILQSSSLEAGCKEAVGFDLAEEIMVLASQLAQGILCTRTWRLDLRQTFHRGSTKA